MDTFTKFVQACPVKKATTESATRALNDYLVRFGTVNKVQSDHGTQFNNKRWIQMLEERYIKPIFSPVGRPNSNIVERVHKEIKRCLRTYCNKNYKEWTKFIPLVVERLNEIHRDTTGFTPNEL